MGLLILTSGTWRMSSNDAGDFDGYFPDEFFYRGFSLLFLCLKLLSLLFLLLIFNMPWNNLRLTVYQLLYGIQVEHEEFLLLME